MSDDERIVLRLSPDTVAVYRALVSRGEFRSINDAVRSVLDSYADGRITEGVVPEYDVQEVLDISDLTPDGRSLDDMVRAAADRYLSQRMGVGERLGRCGPLRVRRGRVPCTHGLPHRQHTCRIRESGRSLG